MMDRALIELSQRFKELKFVKIKSTSAIENFPDKNLPAVFCYHEGVMQHQIVTLAKLGGLAMRTADLEWHLHTLGVLTSSSGPPRSRNQTRLNVAEMRRRQENGDGSENEEEYEDDMEEYMNGK